MVEDLGGGEGVVRGARPSSAGLAAERSGEVHLPAWLFAWSGRARALALAVALPAALGAFLSRFDPGDAPRPAAWLIVCLVVPALVGGWRAAAVTSALTTIVFTWQVAQPLTEAGGMLSVASFAVVAAAVAVLTHRLERAVADVGAALVDVTDRQRQLAEEQAARRRSERLALRAAALLEVSATIAALASVREIAARAASLLAERTGASAVLVGRLDGAFAEVLAADGVPPQVLTGIHTFDLTDTPWLGGVLRGEPGYVEDRASFATAHPDAIVLHLFTSASWATLPMRGALVRGFVAAHFDEERRFDEDERAFLELFAQLVSAALDRALAADAQRQEHEALEVAFAERDRVARTLQTTLAPSHLPMLAGLDLAASLVPGSPDEVAGDFYDVVSLPDGRWLAMIGDVCGKGAEAAAVTALARFAARGAAFDDPDPVHVAQVTGTALLLDPSELYCTMAIAQGGPDPDAPITLVLAGHPKPFLLAADGVRQVGEHGTPLGLFEPAVTPVKLHLGSGEALFLMTDGLLDRNPDFDEDALAAVLEQARRTDATTIVQHVLREVGRRPVVRVDDTAVLVVRSRW